MFSCSFSHAICGAKLVVILVLECWGVGVLGCGSVGVLGCWSDGVMEGQSAGDTQFVLIVHSVHIVHHTS